MPPVSIFIVEDELIEAEDIRQTLENQGYAVAGIARSGESVLETLTTIRPDLVLMDIHLAGKLDGIETADIIRTRYGLPVIFLTSYADEETLGRAKITEPYGYVLKPFDERELHLAIEMGRYKHRMEELATENARTIRVLANAIPDPVMLLDHNRQILALNNAMASRFGKDPHSFGANRETLSDYHGVSATVLSHLGETLRDCQALRFEERAEQEWFEISLTPIAGPAPDRPFILLQYHDITDYKRLEAQIKSEGITQIEQNMEQFQILNDQIRNPLQAIAGYVSLDCIRYRDRIRDQIEQIDNLVARLDRGWVESEKVRKFLLHHYYDGPLPGTEPSGDPGRSIR